MTSHNLNDAQLRSYISTCLSHWGITYIDQKILKAAGKNESEVIPYVLRLAFDISILHLTNYQYTISQLGIQLSADDPILEDLVMAHLCEVDCPFLQKQENQVFFDFQSSRGLLLTCGWLMAVSDFFFQIEASLIPKKLQQIASNKAKLKPVSSNLPKQKSISEIRVNANKCEKICYLYKELKNKEQRIQNLERKRKKTEEKWRKKINSYNKTNGTNFVFENFFTEGNTEVTQEQQEIIQILDYQKRNMGQRKYFWIWLQQKIAKNHLQSLKEQFPEAELCTEAPNFQTKISVDADYLVKQFFLEYRFIQQCKKLEEEVDELNLQIQRIEEDLGGKNPKNYKLIEKEIKDEFRKMQQETYVEYREDPKPSFVGAQLKKYLKKQGFSAISKNQPKQKEEQKEEKRNLEVEEQLKEEVMSFLDQIDAIKFL